MIIRERDNQTYHSSHIILNHSWTLNLLVTIIFCFLVIFFFLVPASWNEFEWCGTRGTRCPKVLRLYIKHEIATGNIIIWQSQAQNTPTRNGIFQILQYWRMFLSYLRAGRAGQKSWNIISSSKIGLLSSGFVERLKSFQPSRAHRSFCGAE